MEVGSCFFKEVKMIYLDNSSTTKQADEVTKVMMDVMSNDFGNPSSLHALGLSAEKRVTAARKAFAASVGARPDEILFNSGGTEGDNTVLFGIAEARKHQGKKIITSAVEHPAILEACKILEHRGFDVRYIGVDRECHLDMEQLRTELFGAGAGAGDGAAAECIDAARSKSAAECIDAARSKSDAECIDAARSKNDEKTTLVSIMTVNNETGAIMPIREIADMAHKAGALMHTDAVQGYGKVNMRGIDADFISVSGHKIHGPKGIGALYARKGINLPPYIVGGGQERNMRSGTENVPAIAGFGTACELMEKDFANANANMAKVRQYLLDGIRTQIQDIRINSPEDGAASVLNVSFLGTRGEVILHTLEGDEIYVSTGSACSSNKKGQSHVLTAMGLSDKEIEGALRFSFSRYNTIEEMDIVLDRLSAAVARFRKLGSYR